jgi:hypothetical protein
MEALSPKPRKVDVLTEMLAVFSLHPLTLLAYQTAFDGNTRLGNSCQKAGGGERRKPNSAR